MDLTQAIDSIRPCTIQIRVDCFGLSEELVRLEGLPYISRVFGTGFFINSDAYVITARHVIQHGREFIDGIDAEKKHFSVGLAYPNSENISRNFRLTSFDIVDEVRDIDLALLKLRENPFRRDARSGIQIMGVDVPLVVGVPRINTIKPKEGEWIGVSGYPLQEVALVTNSGCIASVWSRPNYLGDIEVNGGNSGGPVYLVNNSSIVGVCVASEGSPIWRVGGEPARILDQNLYYSSGLTQIVPAKSLMDVLDQNEIGYMTVEDNQE